MNLFSMLYMMIPHFFMISFSSAMDCIYGILAVFCLLRCLLLVSDSHYPAITPYSSDEIHSSQNHNPGGPDGRLRLNQASLPVFGSSSIKKNEFPLPLSKLSYNFAQSFAPDCSGCCLTYKSEIRICHLRTMS